MGGGHKYTNRLALENNPYLLQHAHNPVDWYPWGDEAFGAALAADKPVFVSIGYSTCHWCHVMEHESFEDERIADILNSRFICIKVDREQRPDVDETYMNAVTAMTGSGGWPLSVFLDPGKRPFFGGTYFPPRDSNGRIGFERLLLSIAAAWDTRRGEIFDMAGRAGGMLQTDGAEGEKGDLSERLFTESFEHLSAIFDERNGGFGSAPKFPQIPFLKFLLLYGRRTGDGRALSMAESTLLAMAGGGINDHIGGGFHRYSTDERWLVPHFEKMLYDQALASKVYAEAWLATGDRRYAEVSRSIIDYVLRDMTGHGGGFYSAEDADSDGGEGSFYVWRPEETAAILGPGPAAVFNRFYGIGERGNFEKGASVLHLSASMAEFAEKEGLNPEKTAGMLAGARDTLYREREKRPRPALDDKIMSSWNGLMISALARAGSALPHPAYIDSAIHAAVFVLENLHGDGKLKRYYRDGKAEGAAFLDDYAFMTAGLLDLYEASSDPVWLGRARELADTMIEDFYDKEKGGFFLAARDSEQLLERGKPWYDGVLPSGNSAAAISLYRLGAALSDDRYTTVAGKTLEHFSGRLSRSPLSMCAMLEAVEYQLLKRS